MTAQRRHPTASLSELQKNRIIWASVISLFFVAAVFLIGLKPNKAEIDQVTPAEFGEVLFSSGKYGRAAETLKASYRLDPSQTNRFQLMTALYASGDYAGVLEIGHDDFSRSSKLLNAEALLKLHRYEEAKRIALDLLSENGRDGEAEFVVARSIYALGQKEAAQDRLKSALQLLGPNTSEGWMFRTRMALDSNEYVVGRSAASRALEAGVSQERIEAIEIEIMIRKGDFDQATRFLSSRASRQQGRKSDGGSAFDLQGAYLRAQLFNARNESVKAARAFNVIAPWLKHEIRGPLQLAAINWKAGDHAQAATLLNDYLKEAPNDWVGLDLYAAFFTQLKDFDAALDAIAPLSVEVPMLGGFRQFQLELASGEYDSAYATLFNTNFVDGEENFSTAQQFLFGDSRADAAALKRYSKLASLAHRDEEKNSIELVDDAAFVDPVGFVLAGAAHLRTLDIENAIVMFDRALKAAPDFQEALTYRTIADIYTENFADARKRLTLILDENPEDISARMLLARVLRVEGKTDNAISLLESQENALLESPENALFYADMLQETGALARLTLFSDLARRTAPEAPSTARLVKMSGRLAEAAKAYRAALLADPDDGKRAREYGRIMETLEREREAISLLDTLVRKSPEALDALEELIRLQQQTGDKVAVKTLIEKLAVKDNERALAISASDMKQTNLGIIATGEAIEDVFQSNPKSGEAAFNYAVWRASSYGNAAVYFNIACFWGAMEGCRESRESDS